MNEGNNRAFEYKTGDILNEGKDIEALVNTVNCVGVMGRGLALAFRNAYPENFRVYAAACKSGKMQPKRVLVYEMTEPELRLEADVEFPKYIVNFPTKRHWRGKSRVEDIEGGLDSLVEEIRRREIGSIAIPPLGSGLGGLDWHAVRDLIEAKLSGLDDLRVVVYEPQGAVDSRPNRSRDVTEMTTFRAVLVLLLDEYLRTFSAPFATSAVMHRLVYFWTCIDNSLDVRIVRGDHGPHVRQLYGDLLAMEGHLIYGYLDRGTRLEKRLRLVPGAVADAREFMGAASPSVGDGVSAVGKLLEACASKSDLELLAKVHWVRERDDVNNFSEGIGKVREWNTSGEPFEEVDVKLAGDVLDNWVDTNG